MSENKPIPFTRRDFIHLLSATAAATLISGCEAAASTPPPTLTPAATPPILPELPKDTHPSKAAMFELMLGNLRYVSDTSKHPHQDLTRRAEVFAGQSPIAAILCCSDSRVPPEIIFDQGLGDLFIVRVAGNVASFSDVIASLEYAVEHLHTPLVLILGHQKCGAITAALEGGVLEGNLGKLMDALKPAIALSKQQAGDRLDNAIHANVQLNKKSLIKDSPIIAHAVKKGDVGLSGAYYNLKTGQVDFI